MWKLLVFFAVASVSSAIDTQVPTISCPTNVTSNNFVKIQFGIISVRTDAGSNTATVTWDDPVVSDNSGQVNVTSSPYVSGDAIPVSSMYDTITFTATDSSGNKATCEMYIAVLDQEDPICSIDPVTALAYRGERNLTINFVITVSDNDQVSSVGTEYIGLSIGGYAQMYVVDSAYQQINSTGTFPIGKTDVNFTVVDSASPTGNDGSCVFHVTINEFTPTNIRVTEKTTDRFTESTNIRVTSTTYEVSETTADHVTPTAEQITTTSLEEASGPSTGNNCVGSLPVVVAIFSLYSAIKYFLNNS